MSAVPTTNDIFPLVLFSVCSSYRELHFPRLVSPSFGKRKFFYKTSLPMKKFQLTRRFFFFSFLQFYFPFISFFLYFFHRSTSPLIYDVYRFIYAAFISIPLISPGQFLHFLVNVCREIHAITAFRAGRSTRRNNVHAELELLRTLITYSRTNSLSKENIGVHRGTK